LLDDKKQRLDEKKVIRSSPGFDTPEDSSLTIGNKAGAGHVPVRKELFDRAKCSEHRKESKPSCFSKKSLRRFSKAQAKN
jgi:hypothetical protein